MREQTLTTNVVYYLHANHLGSASLTTDLNGDMFSDQRYYPYGSTRSGSSPTDRQFTGQRAEAGLGSLYDYGARFYSPVLGRFLSADTMVPSPANPQDLNRYSYTRNNPLRYVDSTGHYTDEEIIGFFQQWDKLAQVDWEYVLQTFRTGALAGRWGWLDVLRQAKDGDKITFYDSARACYADEGKDWGYFSREGGFHIQGAYLNLQNVVEAGLQGELYQTKTRVRDDVTDRGWYDINIFTPSYSPEPLPLRLKFNSDRFAPANALWDALNGVFDGIVTVATGCEAPSPKSVGKGVLDVGMVGLKSWLNAYKAGHDIGQQGATTGNKVSMASAFMPSCVSFAVDVASFSSDIGVYLSP